MICDVVHARGGDHGRRRRVHVPPQEGHWDPPVSCGGIVETPIHSVIPPATVGEAVGWVLRVAACLSSAMFTVEEHRPCRAIPHHVCKGGGGREREGGREGGNVIIILRWFKAQSSASISHTGCKYYLVAQPNAGHYS